MEFGFGVWSRKRSPGSAFSGACGAGASGPGASGAGAGGAGVATFSGAKVPPSDGRASPVQRNQATPALHPDSKTTLGSEPNSSAGGFAWAQTSGLNAEGELRG